MWCADHHDPLAYVTFLEHLAPSVTVEHGGDVALSSWGTESTDSKHVRQRESVFSLMNQEDVVSLVGADGLVVMEGVRLLDAVGILNEADDPSLDDGQGPGSDWGSEDEGLTKGSITSYAELGSIPGQPCQLGVPAALTTNRGPLLDRAGPSSTWGGQAPEHEGQEVTLRQRVPPHG